MAVSLLCAAPATAADAPGAPGAVANWTPGDKDGFGTARPLASKVWFTLQGGELSEVYAPDLGTPSFRDLQFVVSDGRTFSERETDVAKHVTRLADPRSLTYRQVTSTRRWRLTKTYVTDPERAAVLVDVRFESLTGRPYQLYVLADPALSNTGDDDRGRGLAAFDATNASALRATPRFTRRSVGYMGASDGWTDLQADHRMDWRYATATAPGNVVQTAATALTGLRGHRRLTLALGFGAKPAVAARTAKASLRTGFAPAARRYAAGWHRYLSGLERPRSAAGIERLYDASLMVMAATEDKTFRGALIAAPSMPWVWGNIAGYSGPYHLVWSRDAYQVATAMLAAGDRAAANRAVSYLFERQQQADGCFPQNSNVDGSPHWPNLQLDEVADPIILSWQLRRFDAGTWAHVKRAADCIVAKGPVTQERWENMTGYSPASIAAEVAGLVCAAEIATRNGDPDAAAAYLAVADERQRRVEEWTLTTNGPLSRNPYYVRVTLDGKPNAATKYETPDHGPVVDQRQVVDPSFLELARLGVKPAGSEAILGTIPVVDRELGVDTRNGRFWHRFNFDGYGELPDGGPFGTAGNRGRLWPIFAGERGEYELLTGDARAARGRLRSIAATANSGRLLPEQVWDDQPPPGHEPGEPTFSATPLGWTHAQLVRLAWSLDAGRPVEQPSVVARRYAP
ncbi:MAG TPA: glycoside hydrolase family 15 protein [Solirubrobacteraceae bacterium]|nr:glycoside hydrolase family 15 protein [Solirubrobacteraceae bacterium]